MSEKFSYFAAERWLAKIGFQDSRVHSSVEIAKLIDAYSRERISELERTLQTIADFAVGNGDVCEIISKRARMALAASPAETGNP